MSLGLQKVFRNLSMLRMTQQKPIRPKPLIFYEPSQSFPKSFNVAHVTKQLRSEIVPCFKTSAKHVEIRNKLNATADRKFNEPHCVNVSCSWFWFQHGKHILF